MFESKKRLAGVIIAVLILGLIALLILPSLIYGALLSSSDTQYAESWNQEEETFVTYQEYKISSNFPYAPSGANAFLANEICSDRRGEYISSAWNFMVGSAQKYESKMNLSLDNWTVGGGIQVVHRADAESCIKLRKGNETEIELIRENKSIEKIVGLENPNKEHYESVYKATLGEETVEEAKKMARDGKINPEELERSLNTSK